MSRALLSRFFTLRSALFGAFLASACQHDSSALFDDSNLPPLQGSGVGGSAAAGGGQGGTNTGGAGQSGSGGTAEGGKGAVAGTGGDVAGQPGSSGLGGDDGAGTMPGFAGAGGSMSSPPITIEITDVQDAYVTSCNPSVNYGAEVRMIADRDRVGDSLCVHEGLVRASLDAIPSGASVSAATLTLTCLTTGDPVTVSYAGADWSQAQVTWNNRPPEVATVGNLSCTQTGPVSLDLTATVMAWLAGNPKNYGVYLAAQGEDGTDFASSEAAAVSDRPRLSVTYTTPDE